MTVESIRLPRRPLIAGDKTPAQVTDDVARPLEGRPTLLWWSGFLFALTLLGIGVAATAYQIATGIGTWGLNKTVGWAFDITNFVFWVGIGHAGTLISAILFLMRQRWRTSVNRAAEAMTLFAVICAAIFPLIHMGRPWLAFWVFPYPNTRGSLWVNFRSPLLWDVFAISTYFIISAVFWYVGLLPDLATLRDRFRRKGEDLRSRIFGFFSLGWDGSLRTWNRYETAYLLLAGLATPLVLSVHSIVSFDFATSVIPGWHATIFPPYFVAGAIFSGLAMVLTLMLVARKTMRLEDYITARHVDVLCKLILTTSWMVGLAYTTELFTAFWSGNPYEQFAFTNRATGPFGWAYWIMVSCNVLVPQIFWSARLRRSFGVVFAASLLVNVGMWFERFVIIVTSLHRDYLPSSWADYTPTVIEIATLAGTFGFFFTCFLLFCRFLPAIAMAEVKGVLSPSPPAPLPPPPARPGEGRKTNRKDDRRVLLSAFGREEDAMAAVQMLRREGYVIADVHAPYAVHGMEKAAGLPPSRLGWVCGAAGFLGAASILGFQIWTSAVDWPLNVGGKPFNSLPAFVPVVFEVGVLLGGLTTVAALLMRSRLWPGKKPARAYPGVTDDRFLVVVEETDAAFDPAQVRRLCAELGAVAQEERLEEES